MGSLRERTSTAVTGARTRTSTCSCKTGRKAGRTSRDVNFDDILLGHVVQVFDKCADAGPVCHNQYAFPALKYKCTVEYYSTCVPNYVVSLVEAIP